MRAGGIEVCLADRAAVHQKLGFAIKRNAHLCLSLQVTRKNDDCPYKRLTGLAVLWRWRQGTLQIYLVFHWGCRDKTRLNTIKVIGVHNSYLVALLRTGRQCWWKRICEVDETWSKTLHCTQYILATDTSVWPTQLCFGSSYAYSGQLLASRKEHKCGICPQKCCLSCTGK